MDKEGTQTNGPKDKEIYDDANGENRLYAKKKKGES